MKNPCITMGCLVVLIMIATSSAADPYYWTGGEQIPLRIDSTKVTIKFDDVAGSASHGAIVSSISRISGVEAGAQTIDDFVAYNLTTGTGYAAFLDSVRAINGVYLVEPYYRDALDSACLVGRRICVGFNSGISLSQIDSINAVFKTVRVDSIEGQSNVYIMLTTDSSQMQVLDLANAYYELPQTDYAHPIFGYRCRLNTYYVFDYYMPYQAHLRKVVGDIYGASVWNFGGIFAHRVKVAVIDDGVISHEDLPSYRILSGRDFGNYDFDPRPGLNQAHGMGVASIIASEHCTFLPAGYNDSTGVFGLNPQVRILPVKVFTDDGFGITADTAAKAIGYAWKNGAEILSNSWTYNRYCPGTDALNRAIDSAVTRGRNGLGCPVIFAAGNGSYPKIDWPACLPSVLSVGAVHLDDHRWSYSNYGPGLGLVAPSGDVNLTGDVWVDDQMGAAGYNPSPISDCAFPNDPDYDCHFGGTSAACPVVSGTASLLLSYDSTLTASKVYEILKHSAVTHLDWDTTITPPDLEYGYGRVDAFRAILSIARGNIDNDPGKNIDIADLTALIDYLYNTFVPPFPSPLLGDVDCDGTVDVSDLSLLIDHLFINFTPLSVPCFNYGN